VTEISATQAYRGLQRRAREEGRGTEELLIFYAHEGFLRRLSMSPHRDKLVLKGGMLMAVLDARRATRDADLSVRGLSHDETAVQQAVAEIADIAAADGLEFATTKITTKIVRQDVEYHGVRVSLPAGLATANVKVQLDLSFGDPIDVREINYPTLLDDQDITLLGYPIELVLAEKIATMMSRGQANTRDRDFADVTALTRVHTLDPRTLRAALDRTADHRGHLVTALASMLDGHAAGRQSAWTALRQRAGLDTLPRDFSDVVAEVVRFVDPLVERPGNLRAWMPEEGRWSAQGKPSTGSRRRAR
jgi:predicted nucleotidyltransferase component of viral defense system